MKIKSNLGKIALSTTLALGVVLPINALSTEHLAQAATTVTNVEIGSPQSSRMAERTPGWGMLSQYMFMQESKKLVYKTTEAQLSGSYVDNKYTLYSEDLATGEKEILRQYTLRSLNGQSISDSVYVSGSNIIYYKAKANRSSTIREVTVFDTKTGEEYNFTLPTPASDAFQVDANDNYIMILNDTADYRMLYDKKTRTTLSQQYESRNAHSVALAKDGSSHFYIYNNYNNIDVYDRNDIHSNYFTDRISSANTPYFLNKDTLFYKSLLDGKFYKYDVPTNTKTIIDVSVHSYTKIVNIEGDNILFSDYKIYNMKTEEVTQLKPADVAFYGNYVFPSDMIIVNGTFYRVLSDQTLLTYGFDLSSFIGGGNAETAIIAEATTSLDELESTVNADLSTQDAINSANDKVAEIEAVLSQLSDSEDKTQLQDRLDTIKSQIEDAQNTLNAENSLNELTDLVNGDLSTQDAINDAINKVIDTQILIDKLADGEVKTELQNQLDELKETIEVAQATVDVQNAEATKDSGDIETALNSIEKVANADTQQELTDRLAVVKTIVEANTQLDAILAKESTSVESIEQSLSDLAIAEDVINTLPDASSTNSYLEQDKADLTEKATSVSEAITDSLVDLVSQKSTGKATKLSSELIDLLVIKAIQETQATDIKDRGKVMSYVSSLAGKYTTGKDINTSLEKFLK